MSVHGHPVLKSCVFRPFRFAYCPGQAVKLIELKRHKSNMAVPGGNGLVQRGHITACRVRFINERLIQHAIRPDEVKAGLQHGYFNMLAFAGVFPIVQCRGDGL